jgi:hypothetical protein
MLIVKNAAQAWTCININIRSYIQSQPYRYMLRTLENGLSDPYYKASHLEYLWFILHRCLVMSSCMDVHVTREHMHVQRKCLMGVCRCKINFRRQTPPNRSTASAVSAAQGRTRPNSVGFWPQPWLLPWPRQPLTPRIKLYIHSATTQSCPVRLVQPLLSVYISICSSWS